MASTPIRRLCRAVSGADLAGLERFAGLLVEAALPHAAAVKVNLAFFEAFGAGGMAALERLRARIPPDVPIVADAKRGDIGSTAERHAAAIFDGLGADAVTASPYLGADAIEPLLARPTASSTSSVGHPTRARASSRGCDWRLIR